MLDTIEITKCLFGGSCISLTLIISASGLTDTSLYEFNNKWLRWIINIIIWIFSILISFIFLFFLATFTVSIVYITMLEGLEFNDFFSLDVFKFTEVLLLMLFGLIAASFNEEKYMIKIGKSKGYILNLIFCIGLFLFLTKYISSLFLGVIG